MTVRIRRGGLTLRKDSESRNVLRDCRSDGSWAGPASPLRDHPGLTLCPRPIMPPDGGAQKPGICLRPLIPPLAPEQECPLLCPGSLSPGPTPPPTAAAHHSLLAPVPHWSLGLLPQGSVLTNIPATLPYPSLTRLSGVPPPETSWCLPRMLLLSPHSASLRLPCHPWLAQASQAHVSWLAFICHAPRFSHLRIYSSLVNN